MSWEQFNDEMADSGGQWIKLNIGDTVKIQICGVPTFYDKTWDSGNTDRMIKLDVIDLSDGERKSLDAPKRRADPLVDLQRSMQAKGVDVLTRKLEIECYSIPHHRRPGARIGKWKITDLGPADAAPPADSWSDGEAYNGDHEAAILAAPTMEALKRAFSIAHKDANGDQSAIDRYTAAKDQRKADLSADVPF